MLKGCNYSDADKAKFYERLKVYASIKGMKLKLRYVGVGAEVPSGYYFSIAKLNGEDEMRTNILQVAWDYVHGKDSN